MGTFDILRYINFVLAVALLYPSVRLAWIALAAVMKKDAIYRNVSTGMVFTFLGFAVFSLWNIMLLGLILFAEPAEHSSIALLANTRTLLQNILLLSAATVFWKVANEK